MTYYEEAASRFMSYMSRGPMHGDMRNKLHDAERFRKGEMFALNMLSFSDEEKSAGEIAGCTGISSARVAAILGKLEEKGHIVRRVDTVDRRKVYVKLTDEGRKHIEAFKSHIETSLCEAFKRMGKNDTLEFQRLVEKFFKIIHEVTDGNF